jgi:hypothetical protein
MVAFIDKMSLQILIIVNMILREPGTLLNLQHQMLLEFFLASQAII